MYKRSLFFYLALLAVLNYFAITFWYVALDNFFSFVEPNIVAISWVGAEGKPIYHSLESAEQYSLVYGPYLFLITGWVLKLFGPGIASAKLAGALFAMMSVVCLIYSVGRVKGFRTGIIAGGFLALTYFSFWPFSTFIARADAFILGLVGLALAAVHGKNKWASLVLAALALGICVSVKAHAAMYFLPIWVMLWQRFGWPAFLLAGGGAAIIAIAPFAVLANVSLTNYLLWLGVVGDLGLDFTMFASSARNLTMIQLLPVVMILSILPQPMEIMRRHLLLLATLAVSILVILVIASVDGAGKFHLLPFSIIIIHWLAIVFEENYATAGARVKSIRWFSLKHKVIYFLLAVMLVAVLPAHRRMLKLMDQGARAEGAIEDIQEILRAYPDSTIGMGDGENKNARLTDFRTLLVFAGNPYLIDAIAFMVQKGAGYQMGPNTISAIRSCRLDIWLIPAGDEPFAIDSVYSGGKYLYPEQFRETFLESYQLGERKGLFDLWFCKNSRSPIELSRGGPA